MPHRCRKSHYTDEENTHDLIYKKYTIVFKIIDDTVHILTIFKQRTYWKQAKDKLYTSSRRCYKWKTSYNAKKRK